MVTNKYKAFIAQNVAIVVYIILVFMVKMLEELNHKHIHVYHAH